MSEDLEKRTMARRIELEMMRAEREFERERKSELERRMDELPEIVGLACEFLCAFAGIFSVVIGKPEYGTPMLLVAIYLRMGRKP